MVVDPHLKTGRAPFDEVEAGFGLERCDGGVALSRNHVTSVQQGHGHIFALSWVADHHLIARLKTLKGQVVYLVTFVRGFVGGYDGGVADQRIVDARIRDQIRLELVEVDVESAVEAQT